LINVDPGNGSATGHHTMLPRCQLPVLGMRVGRYLESPAVSSDAVESANPGRDGQRVGTARFLGEDVSKIHDPVWGVTGSLGDSQCYLGVLAKVAAIQTALSARVREDELAVRLIAPAYTIGISDGQLNGTPAMRFSLIGREIVNESIDLHLGGNNMTGLIAVVACDKPPVGTLAAILEHNKPAVLLSDGSIKPGTDPQTGERIDIVTGFQVAGDPDPATRSRVALHACPGQGSCGGMFTYNTMQTFIAVLGMEPLQMVAPPSDDPRRLKEFPNQLIDCLIAMTNAGIAPRDIVTPASLRNALTVTIAMGGSTNVLLHSVEIARAAGFDLWEDVLSQNEFNELSRRLPVLVNLRPFGFYSMVDIDAKGGLQFIVKELLGAGLLDGEALTCTGDTLAEQVRRLGPPAPDGDVIHAVTKPFKETGGLRLLHGNLAPDGGAVLKIAGIEGGLENGIFRGRARVFNSERQLIDALEHDPDSFADHDMVVIRYEGPRGAPGMPELLDPTSRITALCRQRHITIALMTDARFSGGSVGLVIGHVAPEAFLGGPLALIEDGDTIVVDTNADRMDCRELDDVNESARRLRAWQAAADANGGIHPDVTTVSSRVLTRMRASARPALHGAGMATG
jgi:dihydroxy-acid dehydratase